MEARQGAQRPLPGTSVTRVVAGRNHGVQTHPRPDARDGRHRNGGTARNLSGVQDDSVIKPCTPYDFAPPTRTSSLTSKSVINGEQLVLKQVSGILKADGLVMAPQLSWSGFLKRRRVSWCRCLTPTPLRPRAFGIGRWRTCRLSEDLPAGAGDGRLVPGGAVTLAAIRAIAFPKSPKAAA